MCIRDSYKSVMDRENDEWFEFLWNRYQAVVEELKFFEHSVASLDGILPVSYTHLDVYKRQILKHIRMWI